MTTSSLAAAIASLVADASPEVLSAALKQLAPEIMRKLTGAMEYDAVFKEVVRRQIRNDNEDSLGCDEPVSMAESAQNVAESLMDTMAVLQEDFEQFWGEVIQEPEFKE